MENCADKSNKKSAERVKELIRSRNMTQEQFAEEIDVSPNYVSMIVNGVRPLSQKLAKRIAEKYEDVRPEYLLGLTDAKTPMEELGQALADWICHHRIVAMKRYLEVLGYCTERHEDDHSFTLYSPENKVVCNFTNPDFDELSEDVYDFVKMKILKMQGRF